MEERRRDGFDLASDAANTRAGTAAADALAPLFDELENEERRLLVERTVRVSKSAETSFVVRATGSALSVALLVLAYLALHRENRRRRESDLRFTRLFESGIVGMVTVDTGGTVTGANQAFLDLLGYSREDVHAGLITRRSLNPPELYRAARKAATELADAGSIALRERVYVRRDGTRIQVLVGGAVVTPTESIAFVADVTAREALRKLHEQLRAEESLRLSEERFRLLVASVKDYAIFMLEPDGRVASWNEGAERIKGYSAGEIIGQDFARFYPADAIEEPHVALDVAASEGRFADEGWRIRKDGSRFWASIVITAVRGPEGALLGFAKVTRDLTERRRADEALQVANRDLEAFSSSVAHDLRAPLRGIRGFAEILLDTNGERFDAEGRECMAHILASAQRMGALIEALLSLARLGQGPLTVQRVDLASMARAAVAQLAAAEPARSVELIIPDALWVSGDAPLLRALLQNLLGNAWKFTSKVARPRIELGVGKNADGTDAYFIRDNGAGFDMTYSAKLFGAFQRLHAQADFAGTGIGLANVHRIVQRHGGRVWAEGAVDAGATFRFTLTDDLGPHTEAA